MEQYSFLDDYSEGCHPEILRALEHTNLTQSAAYGYDIYSDAARALIREQMKAPLAEIFFVTGGTLANLIMISSALRPHEAVIAARSGHIARRETGAIEATGHKVITVDTPEGKLTPEHITKTLIDNTHGVHMAKPRMVYISNATETGLIYTKTELAALSNLCKSENLLLFIDGARLGAALSAAQNELTLADIATLSDMFWIGGTKAGALFGEAIIIPNPALATDLGFQIKQKGALLAKGRVLGLQFKTLFEDGLYFRASKRANDFAAKLSTAFTNAGFELANPTQTNQLFPILPDTLIAHLKKRFGFYIWEKRENKRSVIRMVTSWATHSDQVDTFIEHLNRRS